MTRTLDEAETRELIASGKVGRLGCVVRGEPYVVPINYLFEDGGLWALIAWPKDQSAASSSARLPPG